MKYKVDLDLAKTHLIDQEVDDYRVYDVYVEECDGDEGEELYLCIYNKYTDDTTYIMHTKTNLELPEGVYIPILTENELREKKFEIIKNEKRRII